MEELIFAILGLAVVIILSAYLTCGALFKNFGEKHFDLMQRYFPSFLIWPRGKKSYVRSYKIMMPAFLILGIIGILWLLCGLKK